MLPQPQSSPPEPAPTLEQLQELANQLAERDKQLREATLTTEATTEELQRLRQEMAALRLANAAITQPEADLTELETRLSTINLYLEEAGWIHGQSCTHEHPVQGLPNASGDGFVDYVLWGDDGKPLALVEAKRSSGDPMDGQHQAKLYADALERQTGQRPLIFLSNGYRHRLWDDTRYPPRDVQGFYKKGELAPLIRRRDTRLPINMAFVIYPQKSPSSARADPRRRRHGARRRLQWPAHHNSDTAGFPGPWQP
ncbi:MAG: type I restriction endonuclease, partial [Cyanobacteriota bacterium]|nr:type I restriction endonuclease [Cyanobacteriota bacterium]